MNGIEITAMWIDETTKMLEPSPLLTALQEDTKWKGRILKSHMKPVEIFLLRNLKIEPVEHWIMKRFKVIHDSHGIEIYENGKLIGAKKFFLCDAKVEFRRLNDMTDQEKRAMLYGEWGNPE